MAAAEAIAVAAVEAVVVAVEVVVVTAAAVVGDKMYMVNFNGV